MAFVVETGAGLSDANAYISVEDANAYHVDRGNVAWTGTESQKQVAIVKATQYLEAAYTWITGYRGTATQRLNWPRHEAYDNEDWAFDIDEIPRQVQEATAELALKALTMDLLPALERTPKREKLGPLEVEYADTLQATRFPGVDGLLKGLAIYAAPAQERSSVYDVERS